jgi:hypothetical protein
VSSPGGVVVVVESVAASAVVVEVGNKAAAAADESAPPGRHPRRTSSHAVSRTRHSSSRPYNPARWENWSLFTVNSLSLRRSSALIRRDSNGDDDE